MLDLSLFLLILTADRVTKIIIPQYLDLYQTVPIIPSFFNLTYVRNPGGAFGLLSGWDSPARRLFFIGASVFAIILLGYLYKQARSGQSAVLRLSLVSLGAGAFGNLYDRAVTGQVVDFLDVYAGPYHWPAFNLSDVAITVGVTVFISLFVTGRAD
ncbi:MAG: signal peptidase II [bacterium]